MYEAIDSRTWPSAQGRITNSGVEVDRSKRNNFAPKVSYTYVADSRNRTGTDIWLTNYAADQAFAEDIIASYPVGAAVKVFFNPVDPGRAVLRTGPNWFLFLWCFISWLVTGTGIALLAFAWRPRSARDDA